MTRTRTPGAPIPADMIVAAHSAASSGFLKNREQEARWTKKLVDAVMSADPTDIARAENALSARLSGRPHTADALARLQHVIEHRAHSPICDSMFAVFEHVSTFVLDSDAGETREACDEHLLSTLRAMTAEATPIQGAVRVFERAKSIDPCCDLHPSYRAES